MEHYHVKTPGCSASQDFGIRGVPHVCLVDTEGVIVFRGHPMERPNLEHDIDALLKGQKLQGVPLPPKKQTKQYKKFPESESEVTKIMTAFSTETKALSNPNLFDKTFSSLFVLVNESIYSMTTDEQFYSYRRCILQV